METRTGQLLAVGLLGLLGLLTWRTTRRRGRGFGSPHDYADEPLPIDEGITVARDALKSDNTAESVKILKQLGARRLPNSRKKIVSVAQCVRSVNRPTSRVQQSLYRIFTDPDSTNPKISKPYVVVSAVPARTYGEEQTAIFEAGPNDQNLEARPGQGGNLFPIALNEDKNPMWGEADHAEWRGFFSHKKALAKAGVTHVIPCKGVPLYGAAR